MTVAATSGRLAIGAKSAGAPNVGINRNDAVALLPPPVTLGTSDLSGSLETIYAFQNDLANAGLRDASLQTDAQTKASRARLEAFEHAMQKQAAAERKTRGFWGKLKKLCSTIAKVAGVVVGAAAIVGTGGAAAPLAVGIAGISLSVGGMAVRHLKLLGKDSDKIGMWMELGGAGVALSGAGLAAIGVLKVATNSSAVLSGIKTGATLTQAGSTAAVGAASIAIADFQRDADHAVAERADAQFRLEQIAFERRLIVESAEAGVEASRQALEATRGAIEATYRLEEAEIMGVRG